MVVWLRPEYILAIVTSLYYCSQIVLSKTYEKFYCTTEEGRHQISCPDETALLTDISIRKVYRRTQMCQPDDHSEYLAHCQSYIDGSLCEGNRTCSIEISSRDSMQCGDKTYTPTYFFVRYTCIQIYTMCIDTLPIRNTLYGYIVSPAYPHPMADNLKCSMNIEADPSMYIELSPIEIHLQEAFKCRSEYIEVFGYDSSSEDKNSNNIWKSYHTWCGADRSLNNPLSNTRHLISSNSLYMSLQTAISKKPRYFKIRYKVIPSTVASQSNSNGVSNKEEIPVPKIITSTVIISTTIIIPSLTNHSDVNYFNGTLTKKPFKKEIIIAIMVGIVILLITIIVGILVFIFIKRRRSSTSSNPGKKNVSSPTATNNTTSKSNAKSSDKAPLLEQTNNTSLKPAAAAKQKLVPERTVQISDASTSKFKSNETTGKTNPDSPKPTLTAADSGIYGAEISEDMTAKKVTLPPRLPASDSSKIHGIDLPDVSEPLPTVVVNPLTENSTISAIVPSEIIESNPTNENEGKETISNHLDNTIQSAYSNLIDATISENEGTLCGSALQSRRTSNAKQPLVIQESNNIETIILSEQSETSFPHTIPFNPLHVILKKDAQKYYTTEYI